MGPLELLAELNPIEECPVNTDTYEMPRKVFMIGTTGMGAAFCWDERRKPFGFTVADYGSARVQDRLGNTFEEFLEALTKKGWRPASKVKRWTSRRGMKPKRHHRPNLSNPRRRCRKKNL